MICVPYGFTRLYDLFAYFLWLLLLRLLHAMPALADPRERLLCVWASTTIMRGG